MAGSSLVGSSCNLPCPPGKWRLGDSTRSFGFADGRISSFFSFPVNSVGWEEGEGHGRGGTNFVMTLIIIITIIIIIITTTTMIIIIIIIITTTMIIIIIIIIIITTTTTTMIIINSRFVPFSEQKNSRTFQGHISHFLRTPFNSKNSLEYVSFLVLPQHEQFYPEGLSVFAPCRYLRIRVGQS